MRIPNPFPRLFRETAVHPDNQRLLDELGAYLTSVALVPPKTSRLRYSWQADPAREESPVWTDDAIAAYEAQEARDEHHDNRYEDGGLVITGTVADYDDWLSEEGEWMPASDPDRQATLAWRGESESPEERAQRIRERADEVRPLVSLTPGQAKTLRKAIARRFS